MSVFGLFISTLTGFIALAPNAAAATGTCGFATAGSGTYASTLCWFDLSGYNAAQATSAGGEAFAMTIPGGYTLSFTLKVTGGAVKATALPTYAQAFLGNGGYTGIAGEPALYQTTTATTTTATLSGISLTSAGGTTVTGYSLVGADAESSDNGESITWTATTPMASLEALGNACGNGFTGVGTTTVTCTGKSVGNKTGAAILAAEAPTTFSQKMVGGGLQGVGFGVLTSQLEFSKTVVNRLGTDAFKISVQDASNNVLATANTSGTSTATTGVIPVLAGTDGEKYTLSEAATVGTLANYTQSWSCTRNGGADATLPSGAAGTSASVTLNIGDFVNCTLTNTALSTSLSLTKHAGTPVDVNHDGLTDAGDTIAYTFTVTNNGAIAVTNVGVTDAKVGAVTCPQPTLAIGASETCTANSVYTVTNADVTAGAVTNTATASATVSGTTGTVTSPPSSTSTPTTAPAPALSLTKSVLPATVTTAGQTVTYSFLVKNTGNVTMTGVSVAETAFTGSGTVSAITCPGGAASMAPGASVTCTATYTVSQADLNAGSVSNTAVASGKDPTGTTDTSPTSTAKVTVTQNPALTLAKSVSPTTAMTAGQTLTYSFVITNSGNLTLTNAGINEGAFTGSGSMSAVSCPAGAASLAPGAQVTCTATYVVTQTDIDNGTITNTATATATPPVGVTGPTVSPPSSVTMPEPPSPSLTVSKSVLPTTVTAAGQSVNYSFLVTNTGNVTLHGVGINETAFSGTGTAPVITCPAGAASLAPGAKVTCTAPYTVTQADIDAGSVTNTATASGKDPSGGTDTSAPSSATVTATPNPSMTISKSVLPTTVSAAGQTVTYSFLITNTGNVTMHNVTSAETAFTGTGTLSAVSCPAGAAALAPAASVTCTATYVITQADMDAGSVSNTADATGKTPAGVTVTSPGSTAKVTTTASPALTVTKSVLPTSVSAAGASVTYSFLVKNTGNVTMHTVGINEGAFTGTGTLSAASCPAGAASMAPGASVTCTATYTVTQADMDAGSVSNTATASGKDPAGATTTSAPSTAILGVNVAPGLSVTKSVLPTSVTAAGQPVTYSFLITNTGNVTMHGVGVNEGAFSGTGTLSAASCPAGAASLAPGASVTCTAAYTATQADIDAGSVTNTATVSGADPADAITTSAPSSATLTAAAAPALTVTKTAAPTSVSAAGQTVTYSFSVTNTGNVTMHGVTVNEGAFSGSGTLSAVTCPAGAASMAPGASVTCTATYPVTQADMDAGSVSNTATASGKDPAGATTTSAPSTATVNVTANPSMSLVKSASPQGPPTLSPGEVIDYSFLVTNTGNVTLTNATINEGTFTGSGLMSAVSCPAGAASLAPGASVTCTATYTVTQADIDAGTLANSATAVASPPTGVPGPTISPPSTVTLPEPAQPGLDLSKTVVPTTVSAAGQGATFSFLITNNGNVTLHGVGVNEGTFTGSGALSAVSCPAGAASMAPAASVTCTATYTVTQADIDAGSVSNTATASGKDPAGATTTSAPSTATITATQSPSLTVSKSVLPTSVSASGQSVTYSFVIKNTGNLTVTNAGVNEGAFSGTGTLSAASCPAGAASMAPGAIVTCTATYTVTQADIDAGSVSNTATASATPPVGVTGPIVSPPSTVTLAVVRTPGLSVAKTVLPTTVSAAGQTVTYSFLVKNTGNVTMHAVGINEGAFTGSGAVPTVTCPAGAASMAPGASVTCTATYPATQADIDAGSVSNTATASGKDPTGTTDTSAPSTVVFTAAAAPGLSVVKSVLPTSVSAASQAVTFSFVVTNIGNVTMHAVGVNEGTFTGSGALSGVSCPAGIASMAPAASVTCTATYTATQADVDAGSVSNTATVSGKDPAGATTTSAPSTATFTAAAAPGLSVAKSVLPTSVTAAGQGVTFSFLVTNTGNVTMHAVGVNEGTFTGSGALSGVSCPAGIASMAPGASVTCTATYTVTQTDMDSGSVANTATVSGKDPAGATTTSAPSTATLTATAAPALTVKKTATPAAVTAAMQTVTYSFLVKNTGNVTLTGVTVNEGAFTGSGLMSAVSCPAGAASMAPGASVTCTATYTITQADIDAGTVSNTATALGTPPVGVPGPVVSGPSTATVTAAATPALAVSKTASPISVSAAGQGVTFSFLVTNTGNVTMHGVGVNEGAFTGSGALSSVSCPAGAASMAPGAQVTCTATYSVTQADMDAGSVSNTATVSGKDPVGATTTSAPSTATVTATSAPGLSVAKSVLPTTVSAAGQTVTYSFLVKNTGNVTMHAVGINEGAFTGSGAVSTVTCPAGATSMAPGASVTCTATYTATQADIDAGSVSNTATASGKDPSGTTDTSAPSTVVFTAAAAPGLSVVKSVLPTSVSAASQAVTFSFLVTNTGNVTMHAVGVNEGAFTGSGALSGVSCPAGIASMAPAASVTCTATYTVSQADVDAGSVSNTATVSGKDPAGATTTSTPSTATITTAAAPALTIKKTASPTTVTAAMQTVTYSFVLKNTGNVTLTNASVNEGAFTGSGLMSAASCPAGAASMAPGASVTCTATYTVTQADIDAGTFSNTATGVATPPVGVAGPVVSSPSTATVTATAAPGLSVAKSASPATVTAAGQSVTFSFLVTNTGNVTMHGVGINEGAFTGSGALSAVTCPAGAASMAPGAQVTCTATYTVTQADIDAGSVSNTATASGKDPAGTTHTSAPSTTTVTVTQSPALTIKKSVAPGSVTAVGQGVTYSFLITNTGNVTMHAVTVIEGAFTGTGVISGVTCPAGAASMAPGAIVTCTATYTVTQADIDSGSVSNTATASGTDPSGATDVSAPSTATLGTVVGPGLQIKKTASPTSVSAAGQTVTYSFQITNIGNVTITDASVNEGAFTGTGLLSPVSCPAGAASMAPGASVTCTATYTVTQADIDSGSVSNTATAQGTPPVGFAGPIVSAPSTSTVTAAAAPGLSVTKSVLPTTVTSAGQSVTFSLLVTNTGNVTMHGVGVNEGAFTGSGALSAVSCPAGSASMAPGASVTCTATYTVTQADIDAGSVSNTATVSGKDPAGATTTSAPSTVILAVSPNAALTIKKTVLPTTVSASLQTVTYSFVIKNTGNVTLTNAAVNEGVFTGSGLMSAVSCPAGAASMAPGASVTCTATYLVTQADIDAGSVSNTATAVANPPVGVAGPVVSPPSTVTFTAAPAPGLSVSKSVLPTSVSAAGQSVTFSFLVTNTGNVTMHGVGINEGPFTGSGALSAVTCPAGAASMAPGAQVTCTATYTVTQADIDAGSVSNTATASGKDPAGATTTSAPSTATVTAAITPGLSVAKSALPATVTAAGQSVTYSFLVTNTGNVTMHGITVNEGAFTGSGAISSVTCPAGAASMAPGAQVTCTATYTATQADIDAGSVTNTATVSGKDPAGATTTSPPSTATVTAAAAPGLSVAKSVAPGTVSAAGQSVTYSFLVTNTGNVTMHGITINEGAFTGSGTVSSVSCPAGAASLAPGASVTCTATYAVSQADVDAGSVSNTATASGKDPAGATTTSAPSTVTFTTAAGPALTIKKTASPTTVSAAGQTVTFSYLIKNTGNLTIHGVSVNEGVFTGSGLLSTVTCPAGAASLAPGASVTCTATYTVTQADIDAGSVSNTATAVGSPPAGFAGPIVSAPSTATVTATAGPALTVKKTAAPATVAAAGQTVTYSFLVTNTGNVTMSGIAVSEGAFTGSGALSAVTCPAGAASLAPGASVTCTATYTVTQADIDAGSVSNTATASGKDPTGTPHTSPPSTSIVSVTSAPALTVLKTAAPAAVSAPGQSVTYSFLVTNTGNVTMHGVKVIEGAFSGTGTLSAVTCPAGAASLAPGASVTCTATYTVTQADIDAGSVSNTATASGKDPTGTTHTSPPSTATLTVNLAPALTVKKSASPTSVSTAGQKVTYSFLVKNTGNVTMHGVKVIEGAFSGTGTLSAVTCPAGAASLAPGASVTCTATYTVTQADIDAGSVSNTATASGKDPTGTTHTSPPSTVTVSVVANPALSLVKSAAPDGPDMFHVGEVVTYSFLVTNTGNVTMSAVGITEGAFTGTGTMSAVTCPAGAASLAPGAQVTCTATYTVTQADVDAGTLVNTATATANPPAGVPGPSLSPPSTVTLPGPVIEGLTLKKTVTPKSVTAAGQSVTYSFLVTNTGNVTLTGAAVTEGAFTGSGTLSALSCPAGLASLAPGARVTCTATYTATQADVDAGRVSNTATVGAVPSGGGATVTSPPSTAVFTAGAHPALRIVKTASPTTYSRVGQSVTYSFVVTNTGNVTLTDASVAEGKFTGSGTLSAVDCPAGIASLAPHASVTCTATYTTTQADIDAGSISNTARALAHDPSGGRIKATPASATVRSTAHSLLGLKKSAHAIDVNHDGVVDAGDRIRWTLVATNLGATTISDIVVVDPSDSTPKCPATTLAPGASMTCTVHPHTITTADAAAGQVRNVATANGTVLGTHKITSGPASAVVKVHKRPGIVVVPPKRGHSLPFTGFALTLILTKDGLLMVLLGGLLLALGMPRRRPRPVRL